MTETDLVAAVRPAVERWMQSTSPTQQMAEIANPATLSAVLGLAAQRALMAAGHAPAAVRHHVLLAPFSHLKGIFDAGSLVDTPTGFNPVPDTAGTVAGRAAALAVHAVLQVETVSYGSENDGHLFVNLVAIPGEGTFAEKSKKDMRGHTDGVSFPFNGEDDANDLRIAPSPDLVTLVGLRNPNDVQTKIMPLQAVLAQMSAGDIAELGKAQYSIRSQKTFIPGMKRILKRELIVTDQSLLRAVGGTMQVRYSHSCVVPSVAGGAAETASIAFEAGVNQAVVPVVIQPGDILVINNRLGLHGRGEVGDEFGGHSRWLLRTYGLDTFNLPLHKRYLGAAPPHVLFP